MGLLKFFFRKKRKPTKRRKKKGTTVTAKQQIASIKGQLDLINVVVRKHEKDIDENSALIKKHSQKLSSLEDILTNQSMSLSIRQTNPIKRPDWAVKSAQSSNVRVNKFDVDKFSHQEKRILSIFFEHPEMALSYRDIASTLGKSANTIKNQMHQILIKADLFEKTIDNDMRNRFRLREGIKVEKYLNLDRPPDQPVGINRSD